MNKRGREGENNDDASQPDVKQLKHDIGLLFRLLEINKPGKEALRSNMIHEQFANLVQLCEVNKSIVDTLGTKYATVCSILGPFVKNAAFIQWKDSLKTQVDVYNSLRQLFNDDAVKFYRYFQYYDADETLFGRNDAFVLKTIGEKMVYFDAALNYVATGLISVNNGQIQINVSSPAILAVMPDFKNLADLYGNFNIFYNNAVISPATDLWTYEIEDPAYLPAIQALMSHQPLTPEEARIKDAIMEHEAYKREKLIMLDSIQRMKQFTQVQREGALKVARKQLTDNAVKKSASILDSFGSWIQNYFAKEIQLQVRVAKISLGDICSSSFPTNANQQLGPNVTKLEYIRVALRYLHTILLLPSQNDALIDLDSFVLFPRFEDTLSFDSLQDRFDFLNTDMVILCYLFARLVLVNAMYSLIDDQDAFDLKMMVMGQIQSSLSGETMIDNRDNAINLFTSAWRLYVLVPSFARPLENDATAWAKEECLRFCNTVSRAAVAAQVNSNLNMRINAVLQNGNLDRIGMLPGLKVVGANRYVTYRQPDPHWKLRAIAFLAAMANLVFASGNLALIEVQQSSLWESLGEYVREPTFWFSCIVQYATMWVVYRSINDLGPGLMRGLMSIVETCARRCKAPARRIIEDDADHDTREGKWSRCCSIVSMAFFSMCMRVFEKSLGWIVWGLFQTRPGQLVVVGSLMVSYWNSTVDQVILSQVKDEPVKTAAILYVDASDFGVTPFDNSRFLNNAITTYKKSEDIVALAELGALNRFVRGVSTASRAKRVKQELNLIEVCLDAANKNAVLRKINKKMVRTKRNIIRTQLREWKTVLYSAVLSNSPYLKSLLGIPNLGELLQLEFKPLDSSDEDEGKDGGESDQIGTHFSYSFMFGLQELPRNRIGIVEHVVELGLASIVSQMTSGFAFDIARSMWCLSGNPDIVTIADDFKRLGEASVNFKWEGKPNKVLMCYAETNLPGRDWLWEKFRNNTLAVIGREQEYLSLSTGVDIPSILDVRGKYKATLTKDLPLYDPVTLDSTTFYEKLWGIERFYLPYLADRFDVKEVTSKQSSAPEKDTSWFPLKMIWAPVTLVNDNIALGMQKLQETSAQIMAMLAWYQSLTLAGAVGTFVITHHRGLIYASNKAYTFTINGLGRTRGLNMLVCRFISVPMYVTIGIALSLGIDYYYVRLPAYLAETFYQRFYDITHPRTLLYI
jgi:hypothetical protein